MTNKTFILLLFCCFFGIALTASDVFKNSAKYEPVLNSKLSTGINKDNFDKIMQVLTHERCMNCHPNDDIPKQGEDAHQHYFGMKRGKNNNGFEATKCTTCHQDQNNTYSGVPGAPHWSLAPASMGWQGLTHKEIAESLLNENKNGERSHQDLIDHMTKDKLVLWAWDPGVDNEGNPRKVPPVSQVEFANAIKQWFADGAHVP